MIYKRYLLKLCLFFILFACADELKTTFSLENITTDNNTLVQVNIPRADGNETIANNINATLDTLVASALQIGDPDPNTKRSIKDNIALFNKEYQDFVAEFPQASQPWEAQIDGEILHQSPEIISMSITTYKNTGGAHGILHISLLNFNAGTGERITNEALFDNLEAFKALAKSYFDKAVKDKNTLFDPEAFTLPNNIAYSEDGVLLLYNVYEIAPYASGIIEFVIPHDEVAPLLVFQD